MANGVRDGIYSALRRTENYICAITEDDLPFLSLDDLQCHLNLVRTLQDEYERHQTHVIASLRSGSAIQSEVAARCDFRCRCFTLIDRIEEIMEHVTQQPDPIREPALPEGMTDVLKVMQMFFKQREEHMKQLINAVQTASSNPSIYEAYAACPIDQPQYTLPPITSSGPLAPLRHHTPYSESPTATSAFHVSLRDSSSISRNTMDKLDSEFGLQGGKTCDKNNSKPQLDVSLSCRADASISTASHTKSTANSRRQSSDSIPFSHFSVVHEPTAYSTRSSHPLDSHHPTNGLQEHLPRLPAATCETTRDLDLCYEASLSPEPNCCTPHVCSGSEGQHNNQLEKTYSDDCANWKAPPSSSHLPTPTLRVAQSRPMRQPLHYQEWPPDDDIANLLAPTHSSPPLSSAIVHTGSVSRHKASTAYPLERFRDDDTADLMASSSSSLSSSSTTECSTERSRDDDTADLMASSSSSLSSSSATAQSSLVSDNSPVTPHGSVTLPTSSMANSTSYFPATGHLATATVECHPAEHEQVSCCAILPTSCQELKHPEFLPDISMGTIDRGTSRSTDLPTHLDAPGESRPPNSTLRTGSSSLHGTILGPAIVDEPTTPPAFLLGHHDASIPHHDDPILKDQMIEDSPKNPPLSTFHPERPTVERFLTKSPPLDIPDLMGNPPLFIPLKAYAESTAVGSSPTTDPGLTWSPPTTEVHHPFSTTSAMPERSLASAIANPSDQTNLLELVSMDADHWLQSLQSSCKPRAIESCLILPEAPTIGGNLSSVQRPRSSSNVQDYLHSWPVELRLHRKAPPLTLYSTIDPAHCVSPTGAPDHEFAELNLVFQTPSKSRMKCHVQLFRMVFDPGGIHPPYFSAGTSRQLHLLDSSSLSATGLSTLLQASIPGLESHQSSGQRIPLFIQSILIFV